MEPREFGPLTADKTSYGSDNARVGIWCWQSAKLIERNAIAPSLMDPSVGRSVTRKVGSKSAWGFALVRLVRTASKTLVACGRHGQQLGASVTLGRPFDLADVRAFEPY